MTPWTLGNVCTAALGNHAPYPSHTHTTDPPPQVARHQQGSDRVAQRGQTLAGLLRIPGFYWKKGNQENIHATIISFSCQFQYISHPSIRNAFLLVKECEFEGELMSILTPVKRKYDKYEILKWYLNKHTCEKRRAKNVHMSPCVCV